MNVKSACDLRSHEEEDNNQCGNARNSRSIRNVGRKSNGTAGINDQDEVRLQDHSQAGGDETADGESDQSVRKHVGGLSGRVRSGLGGVVDEECSTGDLGTDVAELGDESKDHVPFLVERLVLHKAAELTHLRVGGDDRGRSALGFRNFGEFGEEKQDCNGSSCASYCQVDVLDVGERVLVASREESLGGDEWTDEGGDSVPRLAAIFELENFLRSCTSLAYN